MAGLGRGQQCLRRHTIGVLGSTGLYPYLDGAERRVVLEVAVAAASGTPVIAAANAPPPEPITAKSYRTSDLLPLTYSSSRMHRC